MGRVYSSAKAAASGGFADPRDFASIGGWWRLDLGVTQASGNVASIADQSSAGNNVAEATNRPLYVSSGQNARPCARFTSGSSHVLWKEVDLFADGAYTIAIVASCADSGANKVIVSSGDASAGVFLWKSNTNVRCVVHQNVAVGSDSAMTTGVECIIFSRTAAAAPEMWVNRTAQSLATSPATMNDPGAGARFAFGAQWAGAFQLFSTMDLYECAVWTRRLADRERQDLENYLMNRYAL